MNVQREGERQGHWGPHGEADSCPGLTRTALVFDKPS